MTRPLHLVLTVLTASAIPACDSGAPAEPMAELAPSQGRQEVPFKETYHATGTVGPSSACPENTLTVTLDGGGIATHVGVYTIANFHCLDPATGAFTGGTFVKTAANGDQLFGTYSGVGTQVTPPEPVGEYSVDGTLVFTGGTGRFAGVSGTETMRGTQLIDFSQPGFPTRADLVIEGTISTVGSRR